MESRLSPSNTPSDRTRETMRAFTDALLSFGDYSRFMTDEVTMTFIGSDRIVRGRDAVQRSISYMHEQAFASAIEVKSLVCGDGAAMIEAEFIGTHVAEFEGIPAKLRPVRVPYSVAYDLAGDGITALRLYFPFELLLRQISITSGPETVQP